MKTITDLSGPFIYQIKLWIRQVCCLCCFTSTPNFWSLCLIPTCRSTYRPSVLSFWPYNFRIPNFFFISSYSLLRTFYHLASQCSIFAFQEPLICHRTHVTDSSFMNASSLGWCQRIGVLKAKNEKKALQPCVGL